MPLRAWKLGLLSMGDENSRTFFEIRFRGSAGPTTVFPVNFTRSGFRAVINKKLTVGSEWEAEVVTEIDQVFPVKARVLWCRRIHDLLWETSFSFASGSQESLFSKLGEILELPDPVDRVKDVPEVPERQGLGLQDISQEELGRLAVLAQICEVFNSSVSTPEIMTKAMEVLLEATGAQRALLLIDRGHDSMEIPAAVGRTGSVNKRYSRTVVDEVRRTGSPVISKDVDRDARFQEAESLKTLGVRSILCVPVKSEDRDFGLIYLDNAVKAGVFSEKDLQLSVVIAGLAASSLARAEAFSQMIQGEKMAALGTMLTGTIHELNNPLTAILFLTEMLHQDGDEVTESLVTEARRCRNMVNQLLQTARTESHTQAEFIALEEVVDHALRIIRPELELHAVELRYEEPKSLSEVKGNSDRLAQILLNLLFNALYELRGKSDGVLEIRLFERAETVYLVVADNGRGVPNEMLQKIYDPFFTTKPAGEGTGMGLAVTHRLVKEHGGTITVENRAEGGAMFTVGLPAARVRGPVDVPEVAG